MSRPLEAWIDGEALAHNLAVARAAAGGARVMAVVKADAYGHGLERVARALAAADGFAVLHLHDAVHLRQLGHRQPILLLEGCFDAEELGQAAAHGLMLTVFDDWQVDMLLAAPLPAPVPVFLKVNSGMNRLGFAPERVPRLLRRLRGHSGVGEVTLMSHFATADEDAGIHWQMERLEPVLAAAGLPVSLANSAALLAHPASRRDWVRPGIMLYGASPFSGRSAAELGLRPVMSLMSRVVQARELTPGEAVGYGRRFVAPKPMRMGVVACGYADGYPRHAGTGTPVRVAGQETRLLGRVSMDMLAVDLTDLEAGVGSTVTLWGRGLPAERVAEAAGTIAYELFTGVQGRVPRVALPAGERVHV